MKPDSLANLADTWIVCAVQGGDVSPIQHNLFEYESVELAAGFIDQQIDAWTILLSHQCVKEDPLECEQCLLAIKEAENES